VEFRAKTTTIPLWRTLFGAALSIETNQPPASCAPPASTCRHTKIGYIALYSMQMSVLLTSPCRTLLILAALLSCSGCSPTAPRCKDEAGRGETGLNYLTV
jgi:hypothetical protein